MVAKLLFFQQARVSVSNGIFGRIQKARGKKKKILVHYVSKSMADLRHCAGVLPNKIQEKQCIVNLIVSLVLMGGF